MKQKKRFNLAASLRAYFNLNPFEDVLSWAQRNINFSSDVSAERNFLDFEQYPYQKEILKQWEDLDNIKEVVVVSIEQMGKTNLFVVGLLWRMLFDPCQSLIVYPSDGLAAEMNQTKIKPLMKHIPQLKSELERPRSFRADRYAFSNLVSYFQGARNEDCVQELQSGDW